MSAVPPALGVLDRIRRRADRPAAGERCDLCGVPVGGDHRHLVDLHTRSLCCACRPCSLLFDHPGSTTLRYRTVPDRWRAVPLRGSDWDRLQLPVGVAFVFVSSATGQASAFYPGPAGATQSLLPLGAWEQLAAEYPSLGEMEQDVEAALVRLGPEVEAYVAPIDACYELVGALRAKWRGFDGGAEAGQAMDCFFAKARARA